MKRLLAKVRDLRNTMITFEAVGAHPVGDKVDLADGVCTERLADSSEGTLFFRVSMKKGSLIFQHHHNCVEEMVLYKGQLLEVINNVKIDNNEAIKFEVGDSHAIYALEDSIFYCQLYKPKSIPQLK